MKYIYVVYDEDLFNTIIQFDTKHGSISRFTPSEPIWDPQDDPILKQQ